MACTNRHFSWGTAGCELFVSAFVFILIYYTIGYYDCQAIFKTLCFFDNAFDFISNKVDKPKVL